MMNFRESKIDKNPTGGHFKLDCENFNPGAMFFQAKRRANSRKWGDLA
jgi:hypothetical protein